MMSVCGIKFGRREKPRENLVNPHVVHYGYDSVLRFELDIAVW